MVITVLAVAFLLFIGFITYIGFRTIIRKQPGQDGEPKEKCAVCRRSFAKDSLLLRQIGDYKLLYFCRECVLQLYADLGLKN